MNPETKRTHPFGVFVRTGQTYDGQTILRVFDPSGVPIAGIGYSAEIPVEERSFQVQILFRLEFQATTEGLYWFDVSYQDISLGGAGLLLEFKPIEENKDEHTGGDA